jgi:hypothetical protein
MSNVSRRSVLQTMAGVAAAGTLGVLGFPSGSDSGRAEMSVTVRLKDAIGTIKPTIYSQFAEHIGGVIYDGIWVGPDSKVPNVGGIRRALIDHVRRLGKVVVRWPGGCFADKYHWRDGIGPRDKRPRRFGRWKETTEPNLFGTHEFMRFCRLCEVEPYFAANVGTGSAEEFQQWVEYCNAPSGKTTLADERAANGDKEPFGVRYWGVGNEDALFEGKAKCNRCHVEPLWTDAGWNLHTADEIGIEDFQANRAPNGLTSDGKTLPNGFYKTMNLAGLFVRENGLFMDPKNKGRFYYDTRFATLLDVVKHYNDVLKLNLSEDEEKDLVEYLKSLISNGSAEVGGVSRQGPRTASRRVSGGSRARTVRAEGGQRVQTSVEFSCGARSAARRHPAGSIGPADPVRPGRYLLRPLRPGRGNRRARCP